MSKALPLSGSKTNGKCYEGRCADLLVVRIKGSLWPYIEDQLGFGLVNVKWVMPNLSSQRANKYPADLIADRWVNRVLWRSTFEFYQKWYDLVYEITQVIHFKLKDLLSNYVLKKFIQKQKAQGAQKQKAQGAQKQKAQGAQKQGLKIAINSPTGKFVEHPNKHDKTLTEE